MKNKDHIIEHYHDIIEGNYDCVDRLVLNAYNPQLHTPGGFRIWYRDLKGTDKDLSNAVLIRMAGRFNRRVKAFCKSNHIHFQYCKVEERKHEIAEKLIPKDKSFTGIFAVLVSRSMSSLWEIKRFENGGMDIRKQKKLSFVNHFSFHIIDKKWGHITIKMCSHPPYSCQIILNGHEWVENRNEIKKLDIVKEGNCFTEYSNGESLSKVAETIKQKGRLEDVCNRWIYRCLWYGLDQEEQNRTRFRYQYSVYQVEYSRNLLFKRGTGLDEIYQNIITLTREKLDIPRLKTIFGRKNRPHNRKSKKSGFEVRIERPDYNMTIFKIHFGKLTVKLYDKGERTLRAEVVVHNAKELKCKRSIGCFAEIVKKLQDMMNDFMDNLFYAHVSMLNDGSLQQLINPTRKGKSRLAGVDINKERNQAIMETVLALSIKPGGYFIKDVVANMKEKVGNKYGLYSARKAAYDINKLRGKGLVVKQKGTRKYRTTSKGVNLIVAILVIMQKQLPGIIAATNKTNLNDAPKEISYYDSCCVNIMNEIKKINQIMGVKLAA
jgi:predicted transcriptional regulator